MRVSSISSAGLIVNYKCSAKCAHCCYNSSPNWDNDYMSGRTLTQALMFLKKMRCGDIHIGGGEPFLNVQRLTQLCGQINESGFHVSYIETNASWHQNDEKTAEVLSQLKHNGINCLLISVDPFHNEFIALERPKSLIKCCKRAGIDTFVWPGRYDGQLSKLDETKKHTLDEYSELFGSDYGEYAAKSYGLSQNGRAINLFKRFTSPTSAEDIIKKADECRGLHSSAHCHVDLYGNYIPPGCTGFKIDINDLDGEIDREKYPAICSAYEGGISWLYEYAAERGFEADGAGYTSKCHLCFAIKKYLLQANPTADIGYKKFFEEM